MLYWGHWGAPCPRLTLGSEKLLFSRNLFVPGLLEADGMPAGDFDPLLAFLASSLCPLRGSQCPGSEDGADRGGQWVWATLPGLERAGGLWLTSWLVTRMLSLGCGGAGLSLGCRSNFFFF